MYAKYIETFMSFCYFKGGLNMESRAEITNGKNKALSTIKYENKQLIFLTKPLWLRSNTFGFIPYILFGVMFGWIFFMVIEALSPIKERFRINVSDIATVKFREGWRRNPVYEFKLENGEEYKLVFYKNDEVTDTLKDNLKVKLEANQ